MQNHYISSPLAESNLDATAAVDIIRLRGFEAHGFTCGIVCSDYGFRSPLHAIHPPATFACESAHYTLLTAHCEKAWQHVNSCSNLPACMNVTRRLAYSVEPQQRSVGAVGNSHCILAHDASSMLPFSPALFSSFSSRVSLARMHPYTTLHDFFNPAMLFSHMIFPSSPSRESSTPPLQQLPLKTPRDAIIGLHNALSQLPATSKPCYPDNRLPGPLSPRLNTSVPATRHTAERRTPADPRIRPTARLF